MTRDELHKAMNEAGEAGKPFLWGIDYEMRRAFFVSEPFEPNGEITWHIRGRGNCRDTATGHTPHLTVTSPPTLAEYRAMHATVMAGLMRGDSFLANLTAATLVECDATLREVFLHSTAPYRLLLGDEFVCFSPEPFVRIEGRTISTYPMKGTADATLPGAAQALLDDYKETCEHHTIVDLMRNDLNIAADDVRVERFRYIEEITAADGRRLLQTSSEICGTLPEGRERRFGDILLPMLPAGSITGAPKAATVELTAKAENGCRGWYTGVFGLFDGTTMVSAVMIRCLQRGTDGRLRFHSGGGITINSKADDEYAELLAKVYLTGK